LFGSFALLTTASFLLPPPLLLAVWLLRKLVLCLGTFWSLSPALFSEPLSCPFFTSGTSLVSALLPFSGLPQIIHIRKRPFFRAIFFEVLAENFSPPLLVSLISCAFCPLFKLFLFSLPLVPSPPGAVFPCSLFIVDQDLLAFRFCSLSAFVKPHSLGPPTLFLLRPLSHLTSTIQVFVIDRCNSVSQPRNLPFPPRSDQVLPISSFWDSPFLVVAALLTGAATPFFSGFFFFFSFFEGSSLLFQPRSYLVSIP